MKSMTGSVSIGIREIFEVGLLLSSFFHSRRAGLIVRSDGKRMTSVGLRSVFEHPLRLHLKYSRHSVERSRRRGKGEKRQATIGHFTLPCSSREAFSAVPDLFVTGSPSDATSSEISEGSPPAYLRSNLVISESSFLALLKSSAIVAEKESSAQQEFGWPRMRLLICSSNSRKSWK